MPGTVHHHELHVGARVKAKQAAAVLLLLRAILALLIRMATWQMDAKDADFRSRQTWYGLRDGIDEAKKDLNNSFV